MKDLFAKIKNWNRENKTIKVSFDKKGIKPKNDWNIILLIAFVFLVSLGAFSLYFYIQVDSGTLFSIPEKESVTEVRINDKLLKEVVSELNDREDRLIDIKNNKYSPANPAL